MSVQHNSMGERLSEILPNQAISLFETTQFAPWGQSRATLNHAQTVREMLARAVAEASDRRHDFVYLHLPVPHSPHAYDRRTQQFTLHNSPVAGYWDSLELLDKTVLELRRAMECSGVWDSTAILLTSDHCNRSSRRLDGKEDHRVPFLLKMPGQKTGVVVREQIHTVLTRDLLRAILRRDIITPVDAAAWLEERGRRQLKNLRSSTEEVKQEVL
jgi:arylsulfatase A-like enzyme